MHLKFLVVLECGSFIALLNLSIVSEQLYFNRIRVMSETSSTVLYQGRFYKNVK